MKLSELIAEIGDENVGLQMLSPSLDGSQKQIGDQVRITFRSPAVALGDLIANEPSKVGLVLWLPGDKFREIQSRVAAARALAIDVKEAKA